MATFKVNSFERAGGVVLNIVSRKRNKAMLYLWNKLVDSTPVYTGTARYSWKLTAGNPSPVVVPKAVMVNFYPRPKEPDVYRYTWRWKNWYIVNNQDYIAGLNDGTIPTKKAPIGWIDMAVSDTVYMANRGFF